MFIGSLKDKIIGRKKDDDYDEIRSRILDEEKGSDNYDRRFERRFGKAETRENLDPSLRPFDLRDEFNSRDGLEPPADDLRMPGRAEPVSLEKDKYPISNNYEIIDRLNFIESQLSAIKSQTELLNERLKNIESKLGYQRRF